MREVFIDTNVIVRLLANDPPGTADRVIQLLMRAEEERISVVLLPLIAAEIVFVLGSVYKWSRSDIASRLLDLLDADVFVVLERDALARSLLLWRDTGGIDFPDAYLAAVSESTRDAGVMSLDRRLQRVPGIRLVQEPDDLVH